LFDLRPLPRAGATAWLPFPASGTAFFGFAAAASITARTSGRFRNTQLCTRRGISQ
jgi:hypothetical protein